MPSHPTRGVAEFLFSQGGLHSTSFVLGFSGERYTPLRVNELNLPELGMEDDVDDSSARGFPIAVLCGWARRMSARFRHPTLAPNI